ncbi:MAG TPA: hypothetical protein VH351_17705 [Bryobacteraceae bacterium]|nr:hypothetical protein [Bryobacteraceae bacterium]
MGHGSIATGGLVELGSGHGSNATGGLVDLGFGQGSRVAAPTESDILQAEFSGEIVDIPVPFAVIKVLIDKNKYIYTKIDRMESESPGVEFSELSCLD